uniref:3-oxo-5-alpha-steroid 4-dehydrogenase family protein n=1 Tax=Rhizophora mucronata TaxID=61149 RepID=A0A2P2JAE9_RHIMU
MAKSVHKKCFHDTFEVVKAPVVQSISLNRTDDSFALIAKELVHREVVEDGVKDQRTQVFPEKKCLIGDLGAQVFENYSHAVQIPITIFLETLLVVKDYRPLL